MERDDLSALRVALMHQQEDDVKKIKERLNAATNSYISNKTKNKTKNNKQTNLETNVRKNNKWIFLTTK